MEFVDSHDRLRSERIRHKKKSKTGSYRATIGKYANKTHNENLDLVRTLNDFPVIKSYYTSQNLHGILIQLKKNETLTPRWKNDQKENE